MMVQAKSDSGLGWNEKEDSEDSNNNKTLH